MIQMNVVWKWIIETKIFQSICWITVESYLHFLEHFDTDIFQINSFLQIQWSRFKILISFEKHYFFRKNFTGSLREYPDVEWKGQRFFSVKISFHTVIIYHPCVPGDNGQTLRRRMWQECRWDIFRQKK